MSDDERRLGFPDGYHPSIMVQVSAVRYASFNTLIPFRSYLGRPKLDCVVACGHWYKLQFTREEEKADRFNLLDHLSELIPHQGRTVGLEMAENGIFTSHKEFLDMCQNVVDKTPEGPLFFAAHNKNSSLLTPFRLALGYLGWNTFRIHHNSQIMRLFASEIDKINPEALWVFFSHSEGGMITRRVIEGMTPEQQDILKRHLYSFALGPALPISNEHVFKAKNIYSDNDGITKMFSIPYLNNPNYNIKFASCISTQNQMVLNCPHWLSMLYPAANLLSLIPSDHSFFGNTYQSALDKQIKQLRKNYGFYDGKTR